MNGLQLVALWQRSFSAPSLLLLINIAAIVEKADEALLPAVYREIGAAFGASPSALGRLTLVRALVQAAASPLAAYAALRYNRVSVVAMGALLWGLATAGVAFSASYAQIAFWRALNGVGLSLVVPAIQSIVADSSSQDSRGAAFGLLQMTSNFGGILGSVLGVLLAGAGKTFLFGLPGWRLAFHLVAAMSFLIAWLLQRSAHQWRPSTNLPEEGEALQDASLKHSAPWFETWRSVVNDFRQVLKIPSFQIIVAQGVVGSFPWAAMAFTVMWLELVGFSHSAVAVLLTAFSAFTCLGGLFGGWFGDRMESMLPQCGRIVCAQISSAIAVPLCFILFVLLPQDPLWFMSFLVTLSTTGFFVSWNAASTNNPIFAEIVPEHQRTSVYAMDRMLEASLAAFAPPTVGFLAENCFGYSDSAASTQSGRREDALALSRGLLATMTIPFVLCCLIYTFLYKTYPVDRESIVKLQVKELSESSLLIDPQVPCDRERQP